MNDNNSKNGLSGLTGLQWLHVDVFTNKSLSGNGLAVFPQAEGLSTAQMQRLTQEMRQFESIFLMGNSSENSVRARIFTMEEELDFAGHPILGAAAALQYINDFPESKTWHFSLNEGEVAVEVQGRPHGFWAEMDQGIPSFESYSSNDAVMSVLDGLGLGLSSLSKGLPVTTISTGLPYVIIPVTATGLTEARIQCDDFELRLNRLGGKFVYLLDSEAHEGRTWDNFGLVEDIATGSAAGPAAAYLWQYCEAPEQLAIKQGRFVGRSSEIGVRRDPKTSSVLVSGDVVILAKGQFV